MHIILLKFGDNKSAAPNFMEAHNAWIARGVADGVFQCVGSLEIGGGAIIAIGENNATILQRINKDPFVENGVVTAEIHHVDVKRTSPELVHFANRG